MQILGLRSRKRLSLILVLYIYVQPRILSPSYTACKEIDLCLKNEKKNVFHFPYISHANHTPRTGYESLRDRVYVIHLKPIYQHITWERKHLFTHNHLTVSTNIYLYIFLGGLLEIPSYVLLWLASTTLGRKKTLTILFLICGVTISLLMALMLLLQEG